MITFTVAPPPSSRADSNGLNKLSHFSPGGGDSGSANKKGSFLEELLAYLSGHRVGPVPEGIGASGDGGGTVASASRLGDRSSRSLIQELPGAIGSY
jgi:hypothetical protein